jgi:hypothetical protein
MLPAANGTDERLDALIDEIRALRQDLAARAPSPPDGQVVLREPAPPDGPSESSGRHQKRGRR